MARQEETKTMQVEMIQLNKKYFLLFLLLSFTSCNRIEGQTIKRTAIVMGSTIEILVRGTTNEKANVAINAAFAESKRLDTLFSTYIKNNNMWRINNSEEEHIIVDSETFFMLTKCDEIWRLTEGAFDAAIGKIIDLVGFEKKSPSMPTPQEILAALKNVGWKKIELRKPNILVKPKNMKISFNAIVPGYAADKCSRILEQSGIQNYMVNFGGEIFAKGKEWKIGIQHPRKENELLGTIVIDEYGVSTSGDYQQYFMKNGKRVTHIFNPVTGYPANECEAVTIIAKDALTADALSTGIFVLGPKKGLALIEKLTDVEGIIVDTTGTIHESSGFRNFLKR